MRARRTRRHRTPHELIELVIVWAVLAAFLAAVLPYCRTALMKARLAEAFAKVTVERIDTIETFALQGALLPNPRVANELDETIEEAMGIGRGRRTARAATAEAEAQSETDEPKDSRVKLGSEKQNSAVASVRVETRDAVTTARGTLGAARRPYALPFALAASATEVGGNVLWLCGLRRPPPGYVYVYGQEATDMPDWLTFSECREEVR